MQFIQSGISPRGWKWTSGTDYFENFPSFNQSQTINLISLGSVPEAENGPLGSEIRRNIFINSPDRYSADYFEYEWDEVGEHSTQFWPNWEILTYPKKYTVRNVKDEDLCNKEFRQSSKHPAGLFSGGCPHNITLGFELTLNQESPHNPFRLLQCRDLDISRLKGLYFSL